MTTFRIPTEKGNALVKAGSLDQTIQSILGETQPEAAYFADMDGARGRYMVVALDDVFQISAIAEPLFLGLDSTIKDRVGMTPEDLDTATPAIDHAAQRYG